MLTLLLFSRGSIIVVPNLPQPSRPPRSHWRRVWMGLMPAQRFPPQRPLVAVNIIAPALVANSRNTTQQRIWRNSTRKIWVNNLWCFLTNVVFYGNNYVLYWYLILSMNIFFLCSLMDVVPPFDNCNGNRCVLYISGLVQFTGALTLVLRRLFQN